MLCFLKIDNRSITAYYLYIHYKSFKLKFDNHNSVIKAYPGYDKHNYLNRADIISIPVGIHS